MKKIVLFVLLFATALAASAQHEPQPQPPTRCGQGCHPKWGAQYHCHYSNYSGPAMQDGWANWVIRVSGNVIWATENFQVPYLTGKDNHNVAWALKAETPQPYRDSRVWEFTDGTVQCKNTLVYLGGESLDFQGCNDGHSRTCQIAN